MHLKSCLLELLRACRSGPFKKWRRIRKITARYTDASDLQKQAPKTCKTLRAPFRPWRQGIPWRQDRFHSVARTREVLNNSTVVAVASLMQDTKHENKRLQEKVHMQRQEIANLRTHMSALELEAELRDFWHKESKEVRYVGNDTFVVAYTLRL